MQNQHPENHIMTEEEENPTNLFRSAIEELGFLTSLSQEQEIRLDVGENGRLVATQATKTRLERMVDLAQSFIGPLFSNQKRREQANRLLMIKAAILKARDIVNSHSPLLEKFKAGSETERKLAESCLHTIQRYNAIVDQNHHNRLNEEMQRLLADPEIKGQPIELPHAISIKYDSHPMPHSHPAKKMFDALSEVFCLNPANLLNKNRSLPSPTLIKSKQFIIDTFQMKTIRLIEQHLQKPIAAIVPLVKKGHPEIDETSSPGFIHLQQYIEIDPGSFILVSGSFTANQTDRKFMAMPILDTFRLSFQMTHTGYPYASQHIGWVVGDKWVDAAPLRSDQTPLFQEINQRRKELAHRLLFDKSFNEKVHRHFMVKREVFDQNKHLFLPLHRQLQQELLKDISSEENNAILDGFYQDANTARSPFDFLVQTQEYLLELFVKKPIRALEKEWLEQADSSLRIGTHQQKQHAAKSKLEQMRLEIENQLDPAYPRQAFILLMGRIMGKTYQSIALQYQSEKMGFSPPLLTESDRKLQVCAFQQMLSFLNECENRINIVDPAIIKSDLLVAWSNELKLIEANNEDEHQEPVALVNELERYFTQRFTYDRFKLLKSKL